MNNKQRYKFLGLLCLSFFCAWCGVVAWHILNYSGTLPQTPESPYILSNTSFSRGVTRDNRFSYINATPACYNGNAVENVSERSKVENVFERSETFSTIERSKTAPIVPRTAFPKFSTITRTSAHFNAPFSTPLTSSEVVQSYGSSTYAAEQPHYGRSEQVPSARTYTSFASLSVNTLLASNTITTAASQISGGVTTLDSDAPSVRRSPTPDVPDDEELPIGSSTSSVLTLLLFAATYTLIKRKILY